ncbi:putative diphosphoinositol polyphosphate phosphohydrolase 1 [Apostichopus japonicus]|uniref:diphosphoinositol-polyphosphate diphosphatase n=1 Tax=Stichopus japonicus TaxID=307972 RepID=A0A2G8K4R6_STIJA|nr:putative diphosphoinositol polyphosphate phosphohydrolase 1 [Apostichopus japonicus]
MWSLSLDRSSHKLNTTHHWTADKLAIPGTINFPFLDDADFCYERLKFLSLVLLVSSSRSSNAWVIPGGGLEPNEDSSCAAVRELLEEAGVTGTVIGTLGPFDDITANGTKHRTSVYSFVVTEEFELWEDKLRIGRVRKWFPIEDALRQLRLYKPNQERYLRKAVMDTLFPSISKERCFKGSGCPLSRTKAGLSNLRPAGHSPARRRVACGPPEMLYGAKFWCPDLLITV